VCAHNHNPDAACQTKRAVPLGGPGSSAGLASARSPRGLGQVQLDALDPRFQGRKRTSNSEKPHPKSANALPGSSLARSDPNAPMRQAKVGIASRAGEAFARCFSPGTAIHKLAGAWPRPFCCPTNPARRSERRKGTAEFCPPSFVLFVVKNVSGFALT